MQGRPEIWVPVFMKGVRRIVIDLLRRHRIDDRDVVGDFRDVGEHVRNHLPRLAAFRKVVLRSETIQRLPLELGDGLPLGDRFGHRLAVHLGQLRLVIERLDMGRSPGHAEKDDPLGLGGVMRLNRSGPALFEPGLGKELVGQCRRSDAHCGID